MHVKSFVYINLKTLSMSACSWIKVSSTNIIAVVSAVVVDVVTASAVAATIINIIIMIEMVDSSKNGGQGDDQSQGSHGIVDCRSNIAANSNSMEGLCSVPLLS